MKKILSSIKKHKVVYFSILSILYSALIIMITKNPFIKIQIIFSVILILYLNKYLYIIIFKEWDDKMIDTHAHLLKEFYDNIEETINNSKINNILHIINCADSLSSSYETLQLSKQYKNFILPAIGIHPNNIKDNWKEEINEIEILIKKENPIAIGESGLDYYHNKENKIEQIELFKSQINLSKKYNLPILIHSREATKDTLDILKETKPIGIIHCFSGSLETAKEYIKLGLYLGIGGVITFKNSKLPEVIKEIPLESIVLETDCPFLTPHPHRGKQNSPSYIYLIAEKIAQIKNISIEEVIKQTSNNAKDLFKI